MDVRISVNHNKVPVPTLEKWNNMNKDARAPGMHLIVGYLKVKTALSALANEAHLPPATAAKQPATDFTETNHGNRGNHKAHDDNHNPRDGNHYARDDNRHPAGHRHGDFRRRQIERFTPITKQNRATTNPATPPPAQLRRRHLQSRLPRQRKSVNGAAGIFKSTSGWQDGKYYALMNTCPSGSIVKVTDGAGKTVYVKVLGQLPEMKKSIGLSIPHQQRRRRRDRPNRRAVQRSGKLLNPVPSQKIHHRHPLLPLQLQLRHADIPIRPSQIANTSSHPYHAPPAPHPAPTRAPATPRGRSSTIFIQLRIRRRKRRQFPDQIIHLNRRPVPIDLPVSVKILGACFRPTGFPAAPQQACPLPTRRLF